MIGLVVSTRAQSQPLFFHNSGTPVAVPCGPTSFFLDETASSAASPVVEGVTVARNQSQDFAQFTSLAFGADTTLLPVAAVTLNLSASRQSEVCMDVGAEL
ncbi:MAG TPA: hypothetical protein VKU61_13505, partial [Candidatus Binatia bacterium]|nr:hypothetical protein [Candidatus Binatia bacterium]